MGKIKVTKSTKAIMNKSIFSIFFKSCILNAFDDFALTKKRSSTVIKSLLKTPIIRLSHIIIKESYHRMEQLESFCM
jgi:hypothetical protein